MTLIVLRSFLITLYMKFLVFQHISVEHPGIFRNFMMRDTISWDTVELDQGESIPDLNDYDALIVMGGPMDVWEEDKYPWLIPEKESIRKAIIELKLPFLGFCLGHQLMAAALGGSVNKMSKPEVGILDIELTAQGQDAVLFSGLQKNIKTLQWHGAAVSKAPLKCSVLASSPACAIQALQYGNHAFSMQCHIELIDSTVSDWAQIPEYADSLEKTAGKNALKELNNAATKNMSDFNQSARIIYDNFVKRII